MATLQPLLRGGAGQGLINSATSVGTLRRDRRASMGRVLKGDASALDVLRVERRQQGHITARFQAVNVHARKCAA